MTLALTVPNVTVDVLVNPVPGDRDRSSTSCRPGSGEMLVMVGAAGTYVNLSPVTIALVPLGVVTLTSTVPVPAGEVAVRLVAEL